MTLRDRLTAGAKSAARDCLIGVLFAAVIVGGLALMINLGALLLGLR